MRLISQFHLTKDTLAFTILGNAAHLVVHFPTFDVFGAQNGEAMPASNSCFFGSRSSHDSHTRVM